MKKKFKLVVFFLQRTTPAIRVSWLCPVVRANEINNFAINNVVITKL